MLYRKINSKTGIFIEDTFEIDLLDSKYTYIKTPIPSGVYAERGVSPKWTGTEWIATTDPPEPLPQPPTVEERLEMTEMVLLEIMMG